MFPRRILPGPSGGGAAVTHDVSTQLTLGAIAAAPRDLGVRANGSVPETLTRKPAVASPYLTITEAADYTRLAVGTLYNAVHRGRLRKQPGSRKVLFTRDELDRFVGVKPRSRR